MPVMFLLRVTSEGNFSGKLLRFWALHALIVTVTAHLAFSEELNDLLTEDDEILHQERIIDTGADEDVSYWEEDTEEFPQDENYADLFDYEEKDELQRAYGDLGNLADDEIILQEQIADEFRYLKPYQNLDSLDADLAHRITIMKDDVADAEEDEPSREDEMKVGIHKSNPDRFDVSTRRLYSSPGRIRGPVWMRKNKFKAAPLGRIGGPKIGNDSPNQAFGVQRRVLGTLKVHGDFYLNGGYLRPVDKSWIKRISRNKPDRPVGSRRFLNNANLNANSNFNVNHNVNRNYNG